MSLPSREVEVACHICDFRDVRTLDAGDKRYLEHLQRTFRCSRCAAPGRLHMITVYLLPERPAWMSRSMQRLFEIGGIFTIGAAAASTAAVAVLALWGFGGLASSLIDSAFRAVAFEQASTAQAPSFCDTRLAWMYDTGPDNSSRDDAYDQLAASCPQHAPTISRMRDDER